MRESRDSHDAQLTAFTTRLAELARLAEGAMNRASTAVVAGDAELARTVVADEESIVALHHRLDEQAVGILAELRPVAADLRTIVAGLRMSADLARMGTMARHVAELVPRMAPRPALPAAVRPTVAAMGETAQRLMAKVRAAMASHDTEAAYELDRDDDEMDRLVSSLYRDLLCADHDLDVEAVLELTLLGRYYERFADHAVSLARRVLFQAGANG
ncbi:phosphate transport system regulatory protein PhoU [Saccharomonospora marina XMU15]|uniref:Phosphate-specific transport system accessory protein PhoU n=1 Tax=Saccharomonospora marina XMU15 TaxID=882083 RepID=H5WZT4_9PSEU|nr:phosphate signaling complex protein PhoU [Saccharomonospora marina]EHR51871.1 phosphate transport system regulatory protein PhoU [Saccharomonospora marina XMU15]